MNLATEQSLPADEPHLTLIEAHQKMDGCRMNLKALQSLKHELLSSVSLFDRFILLSSCFRTMSFMWFQKFKDFFFGLF